MKINKLRNWVLLTSMLMIFSCGTENNKAGENGEVDANSAGTSVGGGSTADQLPANSDLSLSILGKLPSSNLALAATGIEVNDMQGNVIGEITLSDARIVLEQIRLKPLETEDDDSQDEESQDQSALLQNTDDADSDDDDDEVDDNSENEEQSEVDDEEDKKPRFKGPYMVDLLTNTMSPEPENIKIPEGLYRRIELRIHKTTGDEAEYLGIEESDPIIGNSIYLEGIYTPNEGSAVNFSLAFDLTEEFELRSKEGFAINSDTINDFVIAFQLASWFKFDDQETNEKEYTFADLGSESIVLDKNSEDSAKEILETIKENIKHSAESGKDSDGDGEVDEEDDEEDESSDDEDTEDETDS